jgi:hypothetical protein
MAMALGVLIAQVNLIAVWAVLAPGNIVVRMPWSFLLAMAMWYAVVLGVRIPGLALGLSDSLAIGMGVLFSAIIAQVPLWIAKKVFGWRLIRGAGDAGPSPPGPWQFNLRHLLLATFLLAVALSPLHRVLPPGPIDHFAVGGDFFVFLGVAMLGILLYNLFITVPCIWVMTSTLPTVVLALAWLFYCGSLTGIEIGALNLILGPGGNAGREFLLLLLLNVCQGATVFGTLRIFRALGFRLVRASPPGSGP